MSLFKRTRKPKAVDFGSSIIGGSPGPTISNQNWNVNNVNAPVHTIINHNQSYAFYSNRSNEPDVIQSKIKTALEVWHVPKAVFDAQRISGCMKGTRVQVLRDIEIWIQDPKAPQIFWLAGLAGTGKTAIAWTVCSLISDSTEIILGGNFFCSRSSGLVGQRDVRSVVPTLAQLLARQSVVFAQALAVELDRDPDVLHKQIGAQMRQLLYRPLLALRNSPVPILFVIDALDECGGQLTTDAASDDAETHRIVSEMLEALVAFSRAEFKLPIKFFVTSRPETHIRDTPISNSEFSTVLRLHTVNKQQVTEDIRFYLSTRLSSGSRLRARFGADELDILARMCDSLFIVATTALLYILAAGTDVAVERFETLLNVAGNGLSNGAAIPLDRMYALILEDATRSDESQTISLPDLRRLLAALLAARMSLSVSALADLLHLPVSRVRASMSRLHAVLHVPDKDEEPGLRTLHASFGDYLVERALDHLRIDRSLGDDILSRGCLYIMARHLHFNISRSQSSYEPNPPTRPEGLELSLEYACLQWIYHISRLPVPSLFDVAIDEAFQPRLLFWLEIMSVLGQVWRAATMLFLAAATAEDSRLEQFLRDAHAFVASSYEAIERSAPHIYISALSFADKESLIYKTFAPLFFSGISVEIFGISVHGRRLAMTLTGHEGRVNSVTYSPNGRLIVSGSDDGTVRTWDTRTGEETMYPLRSGHGAVLSVAFSPNGDSIASGTVAGTVCIWSPPAALTIPRRLHGHSDAVLSVTFSPNGLIVAAASADMTASLWNVESGHLTAILRGHTGEVNAIAFSSSGEVVYSGSDDGSVRHWNSTIGRLLGISSKIEGGAKTLCFSSDGSAMAIGTGENAIDIRKPRTMSNAMTLISNHGSIRCVQFSPDGRSLVSATSDRSVLLWTRGDYSDRLSPHNHALLDSEVETLNSGIYPLAIVRHSSDAGIVAAQARLSQTSSLVSLAVWDPDSSPMTSSPHAPDINALDSCSDIQAVLPDQIPLRSSPGASDGTEDMQLARGIQRNPDFVSSLGLLGRSSTTLSLATIESDDDEYTPIDGHSDDTFRASAISLNGHTGAVNSVSFSPDGRYVSSGSDDRTVRVWNAAGSVPRVEPLKGHEGIVHSVAISCDGLIASGSDDKSIRVWRACNGERTLPPLLEHEEIVHSVSFSPDGRMIASGSEDRTARLWDAQTGQPIGQPMRGHTGHLLSVTFSPDGRLLATGSGDNTVRVWVVATQRLSPSGILRCGGWVYSVAFSPDCQLLAAGDGFGYVHFWQVNPAQPARKPLRVNKADVSSIVFARDGAQIMHSGDDNSICVRNIKTGQLMLTLHGHSGSVLSVAYSHDGRFIGSGSMDHTVRIWDATTGKLVISLSGHDQWVLSVAFAHDGASIISGSNDRSIRVWDLSAVFDTPLEDTKESLVTKIHDTQSNEWRTGPSGELLMWVPAEYHQYLTIPPCKLRIATQSVIINAEDLDSRHGQKWTSCWRGETHNSGARAT